MPAIHTLEAQLRLPRPRDEVFAFFSDPVNLELLTPPWLRFRILTPGPISLAPGALIDYRVSLRGVPMRWRSRITVWEPPERFVDEQVKGPYRLWRHEHAFEPCEGGTRCTDRVQYRVLFDAIVHRWLVKPDLDRIFAYRRQKLLERFGPAAEQRSGREAPP